ncbi:Na+/H+ antiporter subunit C [Rubellimicrobium sp. CFH 75288]|uniref:Na+/H+ antiporter subunit C n=1 Tax=Rubellimicrobium sp. CFH 75288 TaxID=2697034 RepID=UPI001411F362|nr:Na+/H+ antiporter subunit C [Rubellimicrobium sp. CFH 75288]NAZ35277.1 Na+/H+ antiporter subunit C [Rubellimicrobium sp. CFH 75288]
MEVLLVLCVGALTAASVYLMLARSVLRFLFGLVLLSNAANLVILAAGRLTTVNPPLIPEGASAPAAAVANPLPQALILTAIVIGFGLFAFALTLVLRAQGALGTLDSDDMTLAEGRPVPTTEDGR